MGKRQRPNILGGGEKENKKKKPESEISYLDDFKFSDDEDKKDSSESLPDVRQTVIYEGENYEKLLDYVFYRRTNGDIYLTQKEVINTALKNFWETVGEIPERPDSVKEQELKKKKRIRKGIKS